MTTLSVIIPAYNEENCISDIMNRVIAVKEDLNQVGVDGLELIVVNDGSKDRTREIADEIAANHDGINVINHPLNRGYGAALKTGFSQAQGDLIGFLDADGTYPPESFPQLCTKALNGYDLVIGSRMSGADSKMPVVRRLGNWFFANMISMLGQYKITDSASGMRVFKPEIMEMVSPLPDGLNLTPIMSTRAIFENIRMLEIPINYEERVGNSKLSAVRDGSIYLQTITWTVLTYNPVRIFGLLGLAGLAIAFMIGLALVVARLSGVTSLSAWGIAGVFTALITAVTGVSIFALGATFNYLVSLFYNRPIRQGLFGKPLSKEPLEQHFGWVGLVTLLIGLGLGIISMVLSFSGWEVARVWLYLLGSAMFTLVGIQLMISWLLIRVLAELSQRDILVRQQTI